MRTVEEIQKLIGVDPDAGTYGYVNASYLGYQDGMEDGFLAGIQMLKEGKDSAQILAFARADEETYRSYGDDAADSWQSGYSCALYWVAEQYDWDAEGNAIYREGNIWGQPVG